MVAFEVGIKFAWLALRRHVVESRCGLYVSRLSRKVGKKKSKQTF